MIFSQQQLPEYSPSSKIQLTEHYVKIHKKILNESIPNLSCQSEYSKFFRNPSSKTQWLNCSKIFLDFAKITDKFERNLNIFYEFKLMHHLNEKISINEADLVYFIAYIKRFSRFISTDHLKNLCKNKNNVHTIFSRGLAYAIGNSRLSTKTPIKKFNYSEKDEIPPLLFKIMRNPTICSYNVSCNITYEEYLKTLAEISYYHITHGN